MLVLVLVPLLRTPLLLLLRLLGDPDHPVDPDVDRRSAGRSTAGLKAAMGKKRVTQPQRAKDVGVASLLKAAEVRGASDSMIDRLASLHRRKHLLGR